MVDNQKISIIVEKLVKAYEPKKIYLFGSFAWGKPQEDSDLDILIIVDHSEQKTYKRMKPAYQALRDMRVSKDILVYTEEEFEKLALEPSSLFYKIKLQGVKLYEAA
ncbi:nucleotidyltransferase domain-containing protein [Phosphitispora fastidiosa]|uniref:nucleotidyltransferase domain-containing protein n=1 Tax=Phosphitispora fastidiosa TaxID=2837202 RepID=UPI001E3A4963|nr:nucleotidyltransferase domain-containing protein [Phosphitispora fastidiosa]MBU7005801.1 putative nucleotidyltransferase [Phosphitispora fastidiosa]